MFKVYDKVWTMWNNSPCEQVVFAVIESMDYGKQGTETYYRLVSSQVGTGWGNHEGTQHAANRVFATREELLESL